jgi:hypothetical protein
MCKDSEKDDQEERQDCRPECREQKDFDLIPERHARHEGGLGDKKQPLHEDIQVYENGRQEEDDRPG